MARLKSHNMDDRELAVEQRMFLALRGCHGKTANPKGLLFLEFSYLTIDKRTDKKNNFLGVDPPFGPSKGLLPKNGPPAT